MRCRRELHAGIPETRRSSILHGDYRLDNALVRDIAGAPQLSAILDWEMATLGDSLTDLGLLGLYWNINALDSELQGAVPSAVDIAAGYPTFEELVDEYSETAGVTRARAAVVPGPRGVQARGHPRGHPFPVPGRPDRGRRIRPDRRSRHAARAGRPRLPEEA